MFYNNRHGQRPNIGARQIAGFSMIELLVAVLVMGIGVLGITGLQMVSLQNNREALLRAEATQLAYDMMDRIRANPIGTPLGDDYDGVDVDEAPVGGVDCMANNCTADDMVTFDTSLWKCQLGNWHDDDVCVDYRDDDVIPSEDEQPGLPDGDGSISVANTGLITITVQWTGPNGVDQTVVIDSQS
ncbi:MAG: type IV pilus modification protein PilV [Pseudomonadales bacterium]